MEERQERRERVLGLLSQGHELVEAINGHMTEIERLLRMDDEEGGGREGG